MFVKFVLFLILDHSGDIPMFDPITSRSSSLGPSLGLQTILMCVFSDLSGFELVWPASGGRLSERLHTDVET